MNIRLPAEMIQDAVIGMFAFGSMTHAAELNYTVSWLGNSFSGASNQWVQNFFIHTKVQPDGIVNTWSHWDEGGKKFGVYRDGQVIGNTKINPNSLETTDQAPKGAFIWHDLNGDGHYQAEEFALTPRVAGVTET